MLKVSDAVREIVDTNPFLRHGLQQKLLNLSAVAQLILPLVTARTKKDVKQGAVLMNLSRIQTSLAKAIKPLPQYKISNLTIRSSLCSITYYRTREVLNRLKALYGKTEKSLAYITLTQGTNEVTLLFDDILLNDVKKIFSDQPKNINHNLAALAIHFDERYAQIPGLFYYITQQIALQNISIYEVSSTFTELVIYVREQDIRLAFDTIYQQFCR